MRVETPSASAGRCRSRVHLTSVALMLLASPMGRRGLNAVFKRLAFTGGAAGQAKEYPTNAHSRGA
jgi:hypothetical protein